MRFSLNKISAYFQPILSADTKEVYAYEVLGRYEDEGMARSLGPFFADPGVSHGEALMVDRIVKRDAIKKYAEEKRFEYLFINVRLAWLLPYAENPEEMVTLQLLKEFGIAPEKVVIEITEEEFNASEEYIRAIIHYKKIGCRIALDDYGKKASNIDRLAKIQPDIIKINIDYIHNSEQSYHYREYLRSISSFADSVGIEVLYEGVETERQLEICISAKGRYFQGFLIAVPQPSMSRVAANWPVFTASIKTAYQALQNKALDSENVRRSLDVQVEHFLLDNPLNSGNISDNAYLAKLLPELPQVKRIYLCSRQGIQLSNNIERQSEAIISRDYKNKNWAWRGYFHEAVKSFAAGGKSFLSSAYRDFTTKERMFTYCFAAGDDIILFADIIKED
ncbi:MAG: EAL domain-containing protein [Treponema sp.]|jgi:EAL domain-containing protein (putative c-di-GMP-specific phosphodiesterase class I)|nr:EAL domain-containing protein [Treponema sp.]